MRKVVWCCAVAAILLNGSAVQTASKKNQKRSSNLLRLISLSPHPNQTKFYDPCVEVTFNRPPAQTFNLQIKPKMFRPVFLRCEKRLVWFFPVTKTWKEFSQYNLTLSSSEYFLFDGKRTKSISWHFTTADKQSLAEQVEDIPFDPLRPLQSLTPHEGDNFKIDYPEKGVFTIHLIGTFNAGVNGPPIEEQRKRYYQEIAQAKNNALSWMKSICQDPNKIKIKWEYSKF